MSQHQSGVDARRAVTSGESLMYVKDGYRIEGLKSGVQYCAVASSSTTALTCPAFANLPPGFRFTLDNSNASGTMTLTPDSGSAITVATNVIIDYVVGADGVLRSSEYGIA